MPQALSFSHEACRRRDVDRKDQCPSYPPLSKGEAREGIGRRRRG